MAFLFFGVAKGSGVIISCIESYDTLHAWPPAARAFCLDAGVVRFSSSHRHQVS